MIVLLAGAALFAALAAGVALAPRARPWLERLARGPALAGLAALAVILVVLFQWRNDGLPGFEPFDGRVRGYPAAAMCSDLAVLDDAARRRYAVSELTLDVAFPLVYAALLGACLSRLGARRRRDGTAAETLAGITLAWPLATACADLVENGSVAVVAWSCPDVWAPLTLLASAATRAKWWLAAATLLALAVAAAVALARRFTR